MRPLMLLVLAMVACAPAEAPPVADATIVAATVSCTDDLVGFAIETDAEMISVLRLGGLGILDDLQEGELEREGDCWVGSMPMSCELDHFRAVTFEYVGHDNWFRADCAILPGAGAGSARPFPEDRDCVLVQDLAPAGC